MQPKRILVSLPPPLTAKLKTVSAITGAPQTVLIRRALARFLESKECIAIVTQTLQGTDD